MHANTMQVNSRKGQDETHMQNAKMARENKTKGSKMGGIDSKSTKQAHRRSMGGGRGASPVTTTHTSLP